MDIPRIKVFLSGRLESDWQQVVISKVPNLEYFDPRKHQLNVPSQYAVWDLFHIAKADILFAYMEKDNPSGYGLAGEVGYAKGLGKRVILVDEKSKADKQFEKYFAIIRAMADSSFESMDEGISFLQKFQLDRKAADL